MPAGVPRTPSKDKLRRDLIGNDEIIREKVAHEFVELSVVGAVLDEEIRLIEQASASGAGFPKAPSLGDELREQADALQLLNEATADRELRRCDSFPHSLSQSMSHADRAAGPRGRCSKALHSPFCAKDSRQHALVRRYVRSKLQRLEDIVALRERIVSRDARCQAELSQKEAVAEAQRAREALQQYEEKTSQAQKSAELAAEKVRWQQIQLSQEARQQQEQIEECARVQLEQAAEHSRRQQDWTMRQQEDASERARCELALQVQTSQAEIDGLRARLTADSQAQQKRCRELSKEIVEQRNLARRHDRLSRSVLRSIELRAVSLRHFEAWARCVQRERRALHERRSHEFGQRLARRGPICLRIAQEKLFRLFRSCRDQAFREVFAHWHEYATVLRRERHSAGVGLLRTRCAQAEATVSQSSALLQQLEASGTRESRRLEMTSVFRCWRAGQAVSAAKRCERRWQGCIFSADAKSLRGRRSRVAFDAWRARIEVRSVTRLLDTSRRDLADLTKRCDVTRRQAKRFLNASGTLWKSSELLLQCCILARWGSLVEIGRRCRAVVVARRGFGVHTGTVLARLSDCAFWRFAQACLSGWHHCARHSAGSRRFSKSDAARAEASRRLENLFIKSSAFFCWATVARGQHGERRWQHERRSGRRLVMQSQLFGDLGLRSAAFDTWHISTHLAGQQRQWTVIISEQRVHIANHEALMIFTAWRLTRRRVEERLRKQHASYVIRAKAELRGRSKRLDRLRLLAAWRLVIFRQRAQRGTGDAQREREEVAKSRRRRALHSATVASTAFSSRHSALLGRAVLVAWRACVAECRRTREHSLTLARVRQRVQSSAVLGMGHDRARVGHVALQAWRRQCDARSHADRHAALLGDLQSMQQQRDEHLGALECTLQRHTQQRVALLLSSHRRQLELLVKAALHTWQHIAGASLVAWDLKKATTRANAATEFATAQPSGVTAWSDLRRELQNVEQAHARNVVQSQSAMRDKLQEHRMKLTDSLGSWFRKAAESLSELQPHLLAWYKVTSHAKELHIMKLLHDSRLDQAQNDLKATNLQHRVSLSTSLSLMLGLVARSVSDLRPFITMWRTVVTHIGEVRESHASHALEWQRQSEEWRKGLEQMEKRVDSTRCRLRRSVVEALMSHSLQWLKLVINVWHRDAAHLRQVRVLYEEDAPQTPARSRSRSRPVSFDFGSPVRSVSRGASPRGSRSPRRRRNGSGVDPRELEALDHRRRLAVLVAEVTGQKNSLRQKADGAVAMWMQESERSAGRSYLFMVFLSWRQPLRQRLAIARLRRSVALVADSTASAIGRLAFWLWLAHTAALRGQRELVERHTLQVQDLGKTAHARSLLHSQAALRTLSRMTGAQHAGLWRSSLVAWRASARYMREVRLRTWSLLTAHTAITTKCFLSAWHHHIASQRCIDQQQRATGLQRIQEVRRSDVIKRFLLNSDVRMLVELTQTSWQAWAALLHSRRKLEQCLQVLRHKMTSLGMHAVSELTRAAWHAWMAITGSRRLVRRSVQGSFTGHRADFLKSVFKSWAWLSAHELGCRRSVDTRKQVYDTVAGLVFRLDQSRSCGALATCWDLWVRNASSRVAEEAKDEFGLQMDELRLQMDNHVTRLRRESVDSLELQRGEWAHERALFSIRRRHSTMIGMENITASYLKLILCVSFRGWHHLVVARPRTHACVAAVVGQADAAVGWSASCVDASVWTDIRCVDVAVAAIAAHSDMATATSPPHQRDAGVSAEITFADAGVLTQAVSCKNAGVATDFKERSCAVAALYNQLHGLWATPSLAPALARTSSAVSPWRSLLPLQAKLRDSDGDLCGEAFGGALCALFRGELLLVCRAFALWQAWGKLWSFPVSSAQGSALATPAPRDYPEEDSDWRPYSNAVVKHGHDGYPCMAPPLPYHAASGHSSHHGQQQRRVGDRGSTGGYAGNIYATPSSASEQGDPSVFSAQSGRSRWCRDDSKSEAPGLQKSIVERHFILCSAIGSTMDEMRQHLRAAARVSDDDRLSLEQATRIGRWFLNVGDRLSTLAGAHY